MWDGMVSRTTNPIENYYRQTMPSSIKRIFKTPEGVMNFLDKRGEYWIENISKKCLISIYLTAPLIEILYMKPNQHANFAR